MRNKANWTPAAGDLILWHDDINEICSELYMIITPKRVENDGFSAFVINFGGVVEEYPLYFSFFRTRCLQRLDETEIIALKSCEK